MLINLVLGLYLSVRGMSVTRELVLYSSSQDGSNSPTIREILRRVKIYNYKKKTCEHKM